MKFLRDEKLGLYEVMKFFHNESIQYHKMIGPYCNPPAFLKPFRPNIVSNSSQCLHTPQLDSCVYIEFESRFHSLAVMKRVPIQQ